MINFSIRFALVMLAACLSILGCDRGVRMHSAESYPERLSEWGLFVAESKLLTVTDEAFVYDLNSALFSDHALKLRTVYLPDGSAARYDPDAPFALPVGSIISKTFYYQKADDDQLILAGTISNDLPRDLGSIDTQRYRLMETRLLVKQTNGWDALPYIWDGDDAYLAVTGKIERLVFTDGTNLPYLVPSKNQCAACHATNHTTGAIQPIGIKARHLNKTHPAIAANQLEVWHREKRLTNWPGIASKEPANADWTDTSASLDDRARSYLDINCGHCHNAQGPADTSGLLLDYKTQTPQAIGVCKPPIAAGRGSGGRLYSIVPGEPDASILSFRMHSTDPAALMPELGRALVHTKAVALIDAWIEAMQGECI